MRGHEPSFPSPTRCALFVPRCHINNLGNLENRSPMTEPPGAAQIVSFPRVRNTARARVSQPKLEPRTLPITRATVAPSVRDVGRGCPGRSRGPRRGDGFGRDARRARPASRGARPRASPPRPRRRRRLIGPPPPRRRPRPPTPTPASRLPHERVRGALAAPRLGGRLLARPSFVASSRERRGIRRGCPTRRRPIGPPRSRRGARQDLRMFPQSQRLGVHGRSARGVRLRSRGCPRGRGRVGGEHVHGEEPVAERHAPSSSRVAPRARNSSSPGRAKGDKNAKELEDLTLLGVTQIDRVVEAVERTLDGESVRMLEKKTLPSLDLPKVRRNAHVEILPLSTGCLGQCTYCKTKHARGELGSYAPEALVARVQTAVAEGVSEVWLSSEDTGAYSLDIGTDVTRLFRDLVAALPRRRLVHASTRDDEPAVHPRAPRRGRGGYASPLGVRVLHVPVQAGSDSVLSEHASPNTRLRNSRRWWTC